MRTLSRTADLRKKGRGRSKLLSVHIPLLRVAFLVHRRASQTKLTNNSRIQGSSIINYSYSWLTYFHACASSLSPRTFLTPASALLTRETAPSLSLSILWHSLDYVKRSVNGVDGGGTMFSKGQNDFELTGEYKFRNKGKGGFISHVRLFVASGNKSLIVPSIHTDEIHTRHPQSFANFHLNRSRRLPLHRLSKSHRHRRLGRAHPLLHSLLLAKTPHQKCRTRRPPPFSRGNDGRATGDDEWTGGVCEARREV